VQSGDAAADAHQPPPRPSPSTGMTPPPPAPKQNLRRAPLSHSEKHQDAPHPGTAVHQLQLPAADEAAANPQQPMHQPPQDAPPCSASSA
jgi:hypothetical protein